MRFELLCSVLVLVKLLFEGIVDASSDSSSGGGGGIIMSSPLKTLTIFNNGMGTTSKRFTSARATFLQKFKGGISSQNIARNEMKEEENRRKKREEEGSVVLATETEEAEEIGQWEEYSLSKEEEVMRERRSKMEEAFEKGFNSVKVGTKSSKKNGDSAFQIVGVVLPEQGVKWYARKKPKDAKWNVRLMHVDKAALLRDMFVNGKIDVYAKYENKGRHQSSQTEESDEANSVHVEPVYSVRERNLRTLWNFNPVHYFTQRSGMYWREKRLPRQGLYTDGAALFNSVYRYTEGKNGMKPISNIDFNSFLQKWNAPQSDKDALKQKLEHGSPDVVLEH